MSTSCVNLTELRFSSDDAMQRYLADIETIWTPAVMEERRAGAAAQVDHADLEPRGSIQARHSVGIHIAGGLSEVPEGHRQAHPAKCPSL